MSRTGGLIVEKKEHRLPPPIRDSLCSFYICIYSVSRDSGRNQAHTYNLMGTDHLGPRLMHGNADL